MKLLNLFIIIDKYIDKYIYMIFKKMFLEIILLCIFCFSCYEIYTLYTKYTIPNTFVGSVYYLSLFNVNIIILFTFFYYMLDKFSKTNNFFINSKNVKLSLFNALYLSIVTQTTVGYGDIVTKSIIAKSITILQLFTLILNISLIPIIHHHIYIKDKISKKKEITLV